MFSDEDRDHVMNKHMIHVLRLGLIGIEETHCA